MFRFTLSKIEYIAGSFSIAVIAFAQFNPPLKMNVMRIACSLIDRSY